MIEVTWHEKSRALTVFGHADPRVCAGVSCLTATLFAAHHAPQPKEGNFVWEGIPNRGPKAHAARFVLEAVAVLAQQYPKDIKLRVFE